MEIYVVDKQGFEVSAKTITLSNNSVVSVTDVEDKEYAVDEIDVLTPSDYIYIKDIGAMLYQDVKVHLTRFDYRPWRLKRGWYTVDGNPAINGWYLESLPPGQIRSLQQRDLSEIEIITQGADAYD
jgi:hypothetical protein